ESLDNVAIEPNRGTVIGRALLGGKTVHVHDVQADPDYNPNFAVAVGPLFNLLHGGSFRTVLGVPLLSQGVPIGGIALTRSRVHPFTENQIKLIETFADQAVVAIENTRLFEAERERTQQLTESLQQQTATADVLKVISRSTLDFQIVVATLVESAARLCRADKATIMRLRDNELPVVATYGLSNDFADYIRAHPPRLDRSSVPGRTLLGGRPVQVADVMRDKAYPFDEAARLGCW